MSVQAGIFRKNATILSTIAPIIAPPAAPATIVKQPTAVSWQPRASAG
ncbi:MAG TPA: hypothetical protein VHQ45_11465 [Gemmatimonadaceae bacterium]|nr:hypothetical protein [Gemmatimonadaceae bacterium]